VGGGGVKRLLLLAAMLVCASAEAENRFKIVPALNITEVHDDNLYYSSDDPVADRIRRVTPELSLRYDSARLTARGGYGFDSEQFQTLTSLDNTRARERAAVGVSYQTSQRVTLSIGGDYLKTDTPADLNHDTSLAATRARAERLSVSPSVRFRISPRLSASASAWSSVTTVQDGYGTRERAQQLLLEHSGAAGRGWSLRYEHSDILFEGETTDFISTHTVLAGWSGNAGANTAFTLRAGPRFTDERTTADLFASISHRTRRTATELAVMRTENTIIGHAGLVQTNTLQARFTLMPTQRLSMDIAPAVVVSTEDDLTADVYRLGVGVRFAIVTMLDFVVSYSAIASSARSIPFSPTPSSRDPHSRSG
jgi:hypothetical protein